MAPDRRVVAGLVVASAMALARPLLALADTPGGGGGGVDPATADGFDPSRFTAWIGLAILILIAVLLVRSPRSRRPIAAVIVAIVTALAALVGLVAFVDPRFSCIDCLEAPDQTPWIIIAIGIAIVGVVLMILIIRGGRSSTPVSNAQSTRND
ncbi:MAG: hypothetical protein QOJ75_2144 [Chloroflexota bacterium]|nr:hypothetical protein [Chloroflexota bacterium]